MADIGENNQEFKRAHRSRYDYNIHEKVSAELIDEMDLSDRDKKIYKDVIQSVEKQIVDLVKDKKIALLPTLGSIRRNPIRDYWIKNKDEVKAIRKQCENGYEFRKVMSFKLAATFKK